jgi:hypothetical protein
MGNFFALAATDGKQMMGASSRGFGQMTFFNRSWPFEGLANQS